MSLPTRILGCVLVLGVGCQVSEEGNPKIVEEKVLEDIRPGRSTKLDVQDLLGPPEQVSTATVRWGSGLAPRDAWTYSYSYIFHKYGLIGRGAYGSSSVMTIIFTPEGVVSRVLTASG